MKKWLMLAMLPVLGFSQNPKLNEKKGFKNYIFGTAPNNYKNIVLELNEGDTQLYSLEDKITIDGLEYEYLRLTFHKNRLSVISMQTKNQSGEKLYQSLRDEYGDPSKKDPAKEKYVWIGNKLHLVYEGHTRGEDATVSFYNDSHY